MSRRPMDDNPTFAYASRAALAAGGLALRGAGKIAGALGAAPGHLGRARDFARGISAAWALSGRSASRGSGGSGSLRSPGEGEGWARGSGMPGRGAYGARYAASRPTSLGEGWSPVTKPINQIIASESAIIRGRVQQLVRDFPYFKRARDVMVNYTVGRGLRYEPRVLDADNNLDRPVNRQLEDAWKRWSDEVDLGRAMDIYGIQRLAKGQDVEAGEWINVLVTSRQPGRYLPVGIRSYESDWLTSDRARGEGGEALWDAALGVAGPTGARRAILGGVEYDSITGEVLAYHFREPGSHGMPVRVPAQWVSHGYDVLRPGQLRGISPFVTAILVAHSLHEVMGSELDAAQMASKWLAFVETPADAFGFQTSRITGTEIGADGSQRKIEHLENAILEYLENGQKINFAAPNRPTSNFEPFVRLILRMVAIVSGSSYELLSGDYSGLSYSNLRSIRNDMIEAFEPVQDRQVFQQCKAHQRWFLQYATLTGRLRLPGWEADPARYYRAYWQPSGHRLLDPLRETKAHTEQMTTLTRSPQEICAERGRDLDDVLEEIRQAKALAEEKGLDLVAALAGASTTVKNNPAALGAAEEEDGEGADADGGGKSAGAAHGRKIHAIKTKK